MKIKHFYWLRNTKNNKYFNKRFQRQELFAILDNFKCEKLTKCTKTSILAVLL